jgi:4'-phosphopantetheinyl transferase
VIGRHLLSMDIEGIEIVVAPLDGGLEPMAKSCPSLSAAELERADRFRFAADRRRYVAARQMLRELLSARCETRPESLQLRARRNGKPQLADSGLQFSLSRSGELAAYAFAGGRAVGIDIEAIRPFDAADALAGRIFPLRERCAYAALAEPDKVTGFFRSWTRTEALAKALGGGLTLAREALDAALDDGWVVHSFVPVRGYIGAVACSRRGVSR